MAKITTFLVTLEGKAIRLRGEAKEHNRNGEHSAAVKKHTEANNLEAMIKEARKP